MTNYERYKKTKDSYLKLWLVDKIKHCDICNKDVKYMSYRLHLKSKKHINNINKLIK